MKALVCVNDGPDAPLGATALAFCRAWMEAGHELSRVFFYHDGVLAGLATRCSRSDELDQVAAWRDLAGAFDLDLVLCVGAAQRRGVLDEELASDFDCMPTLAAGFRIAGLGLWAEAALEADRIVRFGS